MALSDPPYATGSCQCGGVEYELAAPPVATYVCYCSECKKLSAGLGSTTMAVLRDSLVVRRGSLRQWERTSDSGARNIAHFCPGCGNRIYHEDPDAAEFVRLKTGTLDDQSLVVPQVHVWTKRKPAWIRIPDDALVYETQDTPENMLLALREHIAARPS